MDDISEWLLRKVSYGLAFRSEYSVLRVLIVLILSCDWSAPFKTTSAFDFLSVKLTLLELNLVSGL